MSCPWCHNPESIDLRPEVAFYNDRCIGGQECYVVCPEDAIILSGDQRIDRDRCTRCGLCAEACKAGGLKMIGRPAEHQAIMREILRDKEYYEVSDGGVTFSGGEPTLHFHLLMGLLRECRQHCIHTNIETNGHFKWEEFSALLPFLDLIYFDLKVMDSEQSKNILGVGSERVMRNARLLVEAKAPVQFRVPLIPGFTDSTGNLEAIIALLRSIGADSVHLLPYHAMGEAKAARVGHERPGMQADLYSGERLNALKNTFEEEHIAVHLYR